MSECDICQHNRAYDAGSEPWLVARLQTGYVTLTPNQYFCGASYFLAKSCVREVFDLDPAERALHLHEMAELAAALNDAFGPRKLNIESLGNGVPHLDWWLTPRYDSDPRPRGPIWEDFEFLRTQWTENGRPSPEELLERRMQLLSALRLRDVEIELTL